MSDLEIDIESEEIPDSIDDLLSSEDEEVFKELYENNPPKRGPGRPKKQTARSSKLDQIQPVDVDVSAELSKTRQKIAEYEILPEQIINPELSQAEQIAQANIKIDKRRIRKPIEELTRSGLSRRRKRDREQEAKEAKAEKLKKSRAKNLKTLEYEAIEKHKKELTGTLPTQEDFFRYAEAVKDKKSRIDGRVLLVNEFVYKACVWSLEELVKSKNKSSRWEFNLLYAQKLYLYLKACRHIKDSWAARREYFDPEAWQTYMIGMMNGWREKDNAFVKRYREFLLECAKKQGKTFIAAGVGMFNTQLDAHGAEVYSIATKQDQAKLSWNAATKMAPILKYPELSNRLEVLADRLIRDVTNNSFFAPLSKESKSDEGINASFCIFDEAALIAKDDSITVPISSMAAREGPQSLFITTPQHSRSTLYFAKRKLLIHALRTGNEKILDRLFGLIFCLDDNDDWHDVHLWKKSNPNLGVSVKEDYLNERYEDAINTPRLTNEILIHHAGKWVGAASAWISTDEWLTNKIDNIQYKGNLVVGVDLATVSDLCGVTGVFGPFGKSLRNQKYHMFTKAWIPQIALDKIKAEEREIYNQAIDNGSLEICGGKIVDYEVIIDYLVGLHEKYNLVNIGFDPANATLVIAALLKRNIPCLSIAQNTNTLNTPTKKVEAWILNNQLKHTGEDFITWQLEGTTAKRFEGERMRLAKADEEHGKIDNIAALINAAACMDELVEDEPDFKVIFVSSDRKGMYWVDEDGDKHRESPGEPPLIEIDGEIADYDAFKIEKAAKKLEIEMALGEVDKDIEEEDIKER